MVNKKVTIEDLAVMVQKGFKDTARKEEMDKRFDEVDKRFLGINQELVDLKSDVSYLKSRVEEIGRVLERHDELLEEHSEELKIIHKILDDLTDPKNKKHIVTYQEFLALESRVIDLEKKV